MASPAPAIASKEVIVGVSLACLSTPFGGMTGAPTQFISDRTGGANPSNPRKTTDMKANETSRYKLDPGDFKSDQTLREDRGWRKMDVRWMITDKTIGSEMTVVGRTILPPGVGAKHALHRHPNAEEWEYIIHGTGIKQVGDDTFIIRAGELAYIPRNVYHGLDNASENEPLITLWGYSGAPSLEKAGYVLPEDDAAGAAANNAAAAGRKKPASANKARGKKARADKARPKA